MANSKRMTNPKRGSDMLPNGDPWKSPMNTPHLPCPPPRDARYTSGMRIIMRSGFIFGLAIVILVTFKGISDGVEAEVYAENRRETVGQIIETKKVQTNPTGKRRTI